MFTSEQNCNPLSIDYVDRQAIKMGLTFRALALRRSEYEGLALETSAPESLHIINPADKTKLSYNTPTDVAPQFL